MLAGLLAQVDSATGLDATLERSADLVGVFFFAVTGAVMASAFEASAVGAVLIGVISAVGGGIIHDVLANEEPHLFHPNSRLYAIPAALGATMIVVAWRNGFYSGGLAIGVAIVVFVVRLAAIRFG